jgi:hypothetical protein
VTLPRRQDKPERRPFASHRAWSFVLKPPRDRQEPRFPESPFMPTAQ